MILSQAAWSACAARAGKLASNTMVNEIAIRFMEFLLACAPRSVQCVDDGLGAGFGLVLVFESVDLDQGIAGHGIEGVVLVPERLVAHATDLRDVAGVDEVPGVRDPVRGVDVD